MPRKFKALVTTLHDGDGNIEVSGFKPGVDKVLLDFGSYSDILFIGEVTDGLIVHGFGGVDYAFTVRDLNGDGVDDTMLTVGDDSVTLLGVSGLHGADFMGG